MAKKKTLAAEKTPRERYTVKEVADALEKTGGFVSFAAKMLKCSPQTLRKYIANYPELKEACFEIREAQKDQSEFTLLKKIRNGDTTALIFHLKCLGKDRGFIDTQVQLHGQVDPTKETWAEFMKRAAGIEEKAGACPTPSPSKKG